MTAPSMPLSERDLKPCPFCGGSEISVKSQKTTIIECKSCGVLLFNFQDGVERDPHAAWNRRTIPDAEPAGWQPIESAPKDGTIFLIGMPIAGNLREGDRRVYECRWTEGQGTFTSVNGFILFDGATHWQPLPTPPDAAMKDAGKRDTFTDWAKREGLDLAQSVVDGKDEYSDVRTWWAHAAWTGHGTAGGAA